MKAALQEQRTERLEDSLPAPTSVPSLNILEQLPITAAGVAPMPDPALGRSLGQMFPEPISPALADPEPAPAHSQELLDFIGQVANGISQELRGVYVEGVLTLPVVQQPEGNPMFVSEEIDTITQFQSAARSGVAGLLAHNYLSGDLFFSLELGQQVSLIYGDGRVNNFLITDIQSYQKLQRNSTNSNYLNVDSGEELTTRDLFQRMYTGSERVTFQTCIKKSGDWSWGRIFITATPLP
jgi:hypothetical protein